jgi:uncharacterized protein
MVTVTGMKIAVYGGTGNIGSAIVAEALGRGHTVTVLSRREGQVPDGATWQHGDAADREQTAKVAADHDVVVSALGPSREPGGDPYAFAGVVRALTEAVGGTRLIVVGGASSLLLPDGTRLFDSPGFPDAYKTEAEAGIQGFDVLRAAPAELDWTYLSPAPEIGPGERTGSYRSADDTPAGDWISYGDYALALVDEIERPAHRRARFTVASR